MQHVIKQMSVILANTYTLYLKTQNYHWHVKGPQFKALHELFESQYKELSEAIDTIAERIVTKEHQAPASFAAFMSLKTLKEGESSLTANQMLADLVNDHCLLLNQLQEAECAANELGDAGSVTLFDDRIVAHEKMRWMLNASKEEHLEN
ncbi:MAG: DNA starvation/stationary phase protection protein [Legionellales bacterium RIFCSPHIGHO2_12_FULL_37_14]|nr:MAG: DNA starvation/stationary phase protection protein [Legionellales bacterium RIFCSPHIGHO2_12_FULL_37_14]